MEPLSGALTSVLVVLLLTSFVKIAAALNIFRYGLGLGDATFGIITIALALSLTAVVNLRQIENAGGVDAVLKKSAQPLGVEAEFRPFLEKHADEKIIKRIQAASLKLGGTEGKDGEGKTSFPVVLCSFLVSELRSAFAIGLMFLIPFVVLDLIVGNILLALGAVQIAPALISLPLKLLLFISIDGWTLLVEKLLSSYQ